MSCVTYVVLLCKNEWVSIDLKVLTAICQYEEILKRGVDSINAFRDCVLVSNFNNIKENRSFMAFRQI